MGGDAIYLGKLYTKDQLVTMYAEQTRKIEAIKLCLKEIKEIIEMKK